MSSNYKYEVFRATGTSAVYHVKRKVGLEWVARGLAVIIGKKQIRMVSLNREVVRTSDAMKSSGQHDAYELAAIEPFCSLVQGGGVNGKHRQLTYKPFSAARIGHQP